MNLDTGELRQRGQKIRLQEQPFQVLSALLERPGEVVSREELRRRLWPADTFVDFDHSLNAAIKRLRDALGDAADTPIFIETLARRGYRFIAPIDGSSELSNAAKSIPEKANSTAVTQSSMESTAVRQNWLPLHRWQLALTTVAVLMAAAVLFALDVDGLRSRLLLPSTPAVAQPQIGSLAVLPLTNLSGDTEQEYFADGMTEELINELSRIGSLKVVSRTSVMQYKGERKKPLSQIGRELNVDAVMEGAVLRSGNRVRITGQLIEATSDHHLWARSYERDLKDVLALQDEVARDIAEEIRIKLTPKERTLLTQAHTVNPEAHEAYLKGRYFYERLSVAGFKEGLKYYQQAIKLDPGYAPAYVGLAASYKELGVFDGLPPREAAASASEAVQKALALDNTSGDAHAVLGNIHFLWDWDWAGADREFKRAMELGPPSTDTRIPYAVYLSAIGKHEEAIAVMREARTLDPISQPANTMLGTVYYWAHRFDEAIDQFQKTLELRPDSSLDHYVLGLCYDRKGMYSEAMEEYLKSKKLGGAAAEKLTTLREAFVKSGRSGLLREELKSDIASSKGHYINPYWIAEKYARLDEKDQAFQWLEKVYEERSHHLALINTEPTVDNLHSDPRFQDLLRRMNFPK